MPTATDYVDDYLTTLYSGRLPDPAASHCPTCFAGQLTPDHLRSHIAAGDYPPALALRALRAAPVSPCVRYTLAVLLWPRAAHEEGHHLPPDRYGHIRSELRSAILRLVTHTLARNGPPRK